MTKYIALLIGMLSFFYSSAQTQNLSSYTVKGIITDGKDPLSAASVILLTPKDDIMQAFAITEMDGSFKLESVPPGKYKLQITYIGFGTFEKTQEIGGPNKIIDLDKTALTQNTTLIEGVEIKTEMIPIAIKKDTVEYNADAFKLRPNATVEELLKRLPGIEVNSDGTITAQGEEVKSVLVDGKEFFGNDPKMATKNIPADAVKKVQSYNRKSEAASFTGVDDGQEEKTLNLELKPGSKVGTFGNAKIGYGTDDRYEGKLSFNKFSGATQISILGNLNNINQSGFSFEDVTSTLGSSAMSMGGRGGGFAGGLVNFGGNSNGITTSAAGGINISHTFSKKAKITTSYFYTHSDRVVTQSSTSENALPSGLFYSTSMRNSTALGGNHRINSIVDLTPDSTQKIRVLARYSRSDNDNLVTGDQQTLRSDNSQANTSTQNTTNNSLSDNLGVEFDYNRKFKKQGRNIGLEVDYTNNTSDALDFINNINTFFDGMGVPMDDPIRQRQISDNKNRSYLGRINYTEPLGKKYYLTSSVSLSNRNNNRIKDFFDIDPATSAEELNEILSNFFDNDFNYKIAGVDIRKNTDVVNINGGVNYHPIHALEI